LLWSGAEFSGELLGVEIDELGLRHAGNACVLASSSAEIQCPEAALEHLQVDVGAHKQVRTRCEISEVVHKCAGPGADSPNSEVRFFSGAEGEVRVRRAHLHQPTRVRHLAHVSC
jgi:hypothetical protein